MKEQLALTFAVVLAAASVSALPPVYAGLTEERARLLEESGIAVTDGAAPGYVEDGECAACHRSIARSYREVGMSRSFGRPGDNGWVEDFEASALFHRKSGRYYELEREGNRLVFRRYQKDERGQPINEYRRAVDWVLGSGTVSRSYLIQTPAGELYQLPVSWYSQGAGWQMSPGFDRPDHQGLSRRARRECLFCHNAYPQVAAGSDAQAKPQLFPTALPRGIGCQRCHGPGAGHIAAVLAGSSPDEVAAEIVNPARLSKERRRDVCGQCHYQPAVSLFGIRRYERGDYSFVPGQELDEYIVQVEVAEKGRLFGDRFEINHHAYRLEQSECFIRSRGRLECLTCHDPHSKPPRPQRLAKVREACLGCHRDAASSGEARFIREDHFVQSDCVSCHMPLRRAQDVVHAVMTDHRIQRGPAPAGLLAPLEEHGPELEDLQLIRPERVGALGPFYLVSGLIRNGRFESVDDFEAALWRRESSQITPFFDLARARLLQRRWHQARRAIDEILKREPLEPVALLWLALADDGVGKGGSARARLEALLDQDPLPPEVPFDLGLIEAGLGDHEAALSSLRRAAELRPNMASVWRNTGVSQARLERHREAAEAYRQALVIDPSDSASYRGIVEALIELGEVLEARRYFEHGLKHAADPGRLSDVVWR